MKYLICNSLAESIGRGQERGEVGGGHFAGRDRGLLYYAGMLASDLGKDKKKDFSLFFGTPGLRFLH